SSAVKSWPGLCSGGWRSRTSRVMTMASTASLDAPAQPVSDRCPDRSSDWLIGALFPTRLDHRSLFTIVTGRSAGTSRVRAWDGWLAQRARSWLARSRPPVAARERRYAQAAHRLGSGRPAPPTSSLVAAAGAAAGGVFDQGVAEQPGLDGLGVAVQAAAGGQDHASRDIAGVAAVRPSWQSRQRAGSWLRGLGPDGAEQPIGAGFADPGRGCDVAGVQAGAGGALAGDQLPYPTAAVWLGPAAVAGGGAVVGCGQLRSDDRRRGGVAVA